MSERKPTPQTTTEDDEEEAVTRLQRNQRDIILHSGNDGSFSHRLQLVSISYLAAISFKRNLKSVRLILALQYPKTEPQVGVLLVVAL